MTKLLKFRNPYDIETNEKLAAETAIDFSDDPGKTIQEPTEDADINVLMKRMGVKDGSALPYFTRPEALYGDFSEFPTDPTEAANILREGQLAFMRLPAELRRRYETPERLFEFLSNNQNYDEAVKLGLLQKRPKPKETPGVSPSTSSVKEPTSAQPTSDKESK